LGIRRTFYPIASRQKGVEALDKRRVSVEEVGNALDDSRCIDSRNERGSEGGSFKKLEDKENALLVLEFLHDVEEMIVHIRLVLKLDLHSVEVAQGICHI